MVDYGADLSFLNHCDAGPVCSDGDPAVRQAQRPAREEAPIIPAYSVPPRVLGIEEAAKTESEPVSLREAVGRVSGGYLWAYPPGIPLVVPGEQITAGLAETVGRLKRAEVKLVGAGDADRLSIPVLR